VTALRDEGNVPAYWIRPPRVPSTQVGHHRFVWDLRGEAPAAMRFDYPIAAVPANTVREPRGPWAVPGRFIVKLTAGGASVTRPLIVKMDPRVKTPQRDIVQQHRLTATIMLSLQKDHEALMAIRQARSQLQARRKGALSPAIATLDDADRALARLEDGAPAAGPAARAAEPGLAGLNAQLVTLYRQVQQADVAPSPRVQAAAAALDRKVAQLLDQWRELRSRLAGII
jgi:hypothetical protein